jgi:tetratricopeptide (TPR) repeat protein
MFNRRKKEKPRVEVLDDKSVAQLRGRHEEMSRLAGQAAALMAAGRLADAEQVLTAAEQLAHQFISEPAFLVFRLLGQCARVNLRFEEARKYYGRAYHIASELGDATERTPGFLRSIAIAGFASVALAEGDLPEANEAFGMAVELTRHFGDGANLAAVLQSQAEVLHRMRDEPRRDGPRHRPGHGRGGLCRGTRPHPPAERTRRRGALHGGLPAPGRGDRR